MKIFLLEDDMVICNLLKTFFCDFQKWDMEVIHSVSGAQNVDWKNFDVVILDNQLPDGNSSSLIQTIFDNGITNIYVTSGGTIDEEKIDGIKYVNKPYSPFDLIKMIKENNEGKYKMKNFLDEVFDEFIKSHIIERRGKEVVADGIQCPNCGCHETYKPARDQQNTERWFFMIRAFRVDNKSECCNCGSWF